MTFFGYVRRLSLNLNNRSDLVESDLSKYWKKGKYILLILFILFQIGIYTCAQKRLKHPSIVPNKQGIGEYDGAQINEAKESFLESSSFGFRQERPLLNLALSHLKAKEYEDAHNLADSLIGSNRFFWEAYHTDGHILFQWGKESLDSKSCNYDQTLLLWEFSKKRFLGSTFLSFLKFNFLMSKESYVLLNDVTKAIASLPSWQEQCKNPPKNSGGGDSNEGGDSSGGGDKQTEGNADQSDGDDKGNSKKDNKSNSDEAKGDPKDKGDVNKQDIKEKKEKLEAERNEKQKNSQISEDESKTLEEASNNITPKEQGFWNRKNFRHKQEIPMITKRSILEESMKNAKP
jgi:hypothetical protein